MFDFQFSWRKSWVKFWQNAFLSVGFLGSYLLGMCHWPLRTLYRIFCDQLQTPSYLLLDDCHFHDPSGNNFLITNLPLFISLLTPKIPKMCETILIILLKMQPNYSQSSRENTNYLLTHLINLLVGSTPPSSFWGFGLFPSHLCRSLPRLILRQNYRTLVN